MPIVILGGAKTDNIEATFDDVYYSVQAGGKRIAMGRNIWQGGNTKVMVETMVGIIHEGWTVAQAMKHVK